jgi:hypothetical protein
MWHELGGRGGGGGGGVRGESYKLFMRRPERNRPLGRLRVMGNG